MSENGVLSCNLKDGLDDGGDDILSHLDDLRDKLGRPGAIKALQVRDRHGRGVKAAFDDVSVPLTHTHTHSHTHTHTRCPRRQSHFADEAEIVNHLAFYAACSEHERLDVTQSPASASAVRV